MKAHICSLMGRLKFPTDAQQVFLRAFEKITGAAETNKAFAELLQQYEENEHCDYKQMLSEMVALGEVYSIHPYTASMLLFLCLSKTLLERYRQRGIDEGIYYRSIADLAYKLEECRLVHGIHGSFVASWFAGFFALKRFGLGRLQFEIVSTSEDYRLSGILVPAGSKAINVHIPRTGTKLLHSEVEESYRLAAEMFAGEFVDQPILFTCKSWLLDPWNQTVLKPGSNLALFCKDFEIVKSGDYEGYGELWRLFDCQYTGDASKLPRDSSLRRAYADRVERGEPIGWGVGLFLYHGSD